MNFEFYTAHMDTLTELKQLADKHGYKIIFTIRSNPNLLDDIDIDYLVKHFTCPLDIAEEICDKCDFDIAVAGESFFICFELWRENEYNALSKFESDFGFKVHINKYHEDLSEEALEWLRDHSVNADWGLGDNNDFILIDRYEKEEVRGFNGIKKEGWCYRTGMILAVFAQLVCDYLGEERIKRTY